MWLFTKHSPFTSRGFQVRSCSLTKGKNSLGRHSDRQACSYDTRNWNFHFSICDLIMNIDANSSTTSSNSLSASTDATAVQETNTTCLNSASLCILYTSLVRTLVHSNSIYTHTNNQPLKSGHLSNEGLDTLVIHTLRDLLHYTLHHSHTKNR